MPKEPKFFIGIDIGHGETSASRIPGYHDQKISHIPLIDGQEKIISAICSNDGREWSLVASPTDLLKPHIRCTFKNQVNKLNEENREALREFGKLIFKRILEKDDELEYDPVTGEANFVICIACPTQWRKDDSSAPDEYLNFFRNEADILPAKMCINESDAAFFTHYNKEYSAGKDTLVIDLGSSTTDFTIYQNGKVIPDLCLSPQIGASRIEKSVTNLILQDEEARAKILEAARLRHQYKPDKYGPDVPDVDIDTQDETMAISMLARKAKENFFSDEPPLPHDYKPDPDIDYPGGSDDYDLRIVMKNLVPKQLWLKKHNDDKGLRTDIAYISLSHDEFIDMIRNFRIELLEDVKINAHKLEDYGVSPELVILSGGASRMNFFQHDVMSVFQDAEVKRDNAPAWVVSDGAAKYIQEHYKALNKMVDELQQADYGKLLVDSDIEATCEATRQLIPPILEELTGYYDYNAKLFVDTVAEFIKTLDPDNPQYYELFQSQAKKNLQHKVGLAISKAIKDVFNIDIDLSDIKLSIEFPMAQWPAGYFTRGQQGYRAVESIVTRIGNSMLEDDSLLPNDYHLAFNLNKSRNQAERQIIAKNLCESLSNAEQNPLGIGWNGEYLNTLTVKLKEMVLELAGQIFNERGLFQASVSASSPAKNK
ncbi:MAG: hypothetical protein J6C77_04845 [Muribaculaceae bacterium]|nr:hypothetical protein [Muribaculaceae bacterium]